MGLGLGDQQQWAGGSVWADGSILCGGGGGRKPSAVMTMHATGGFPGGADGKEPTSQCRRRERRGFDPWVGKILWRSPRQPSPVLLPGESHGRGAWWSTVHGVAKSQT